MSYSIVNVKRVMDLCLQKMLNIKPMLTLLDQYTGDADLGITMEAGAMALYEYMKEYQSAEIGTLFFNGGTVFINASKCQMGKLLGNAMVSLGGSWNGKTELADQDVLQSADIIINSISFVGKAHLGDKTILDALIPLNDAFHDAYRRGNDLSVSFQIAARQAKMAAKATKGMVAMVGRAKWAGERSRDFPDPGAVMCALIADAIAFPDRVGGHVLPKYE